jgi:preprotein translocase subunit SecG
MTAVIITLFVLVAFVFYYIGKYQERIEWNKLIKNGTLPKPKKSK